MLKRIAFILLLVSAIGCGLWGYFYLSDLKKPAQNPLQLLPDNCYLLLRATSFHALNEKLNGGNLIWEECLKAKDIQAFNQLLRKADSLVYKNPAFSVATIYAAFYGNKKNVIGFNLSDINHTEPFISFLEKNCAGKKEEADFYSCRLNQLTFYTYIKSGLILICGDKDFLRLLPAKKGNSLQETKTLNALLAAADPESEVNAFINGNVFLKEGSRYFFSENIDMPSKDWFSADIMISPTQLNAQGFLSNDSSVFYKTVISAKKFPVKDAFTFLPYNTASAQLVSIGNYKEFVFSQANEESRKASLKAYSDTLAADAQTEMEKFTGDFCGLFSVKNGNEKTGLGILHVSDSEKAQAFIKAVSDSSVVKDSVHIYFAENLFGNLCAGFFKVQFNRLALVGNALLFANDEQPLIDYARSVGEKNNLSLNERASSFASTNFDNEASYFAFADVFKMKDEIEKNASSSVKFLLSQNPGMPEKYDYAGISVQRLKSNLFYRASLGFNPKNKSYHNTLWETLLDTNASANPALLINHLTNEKELAIADEAGTVYLLSNTGKILWKKNAGEKVLGEIKQVDYFNNGKLQLCFNTENYLHIIDRNGNYVSGFPVKLPSPAAAGFTLFDYEHNNTYRLWLPLKNGTTACFAINGKQLIDFSPVKVSGDPVHIILQQKDYFILHDSAGNIAITNRKGESRLKITSKLPPQTDNIFISEGKDAASTFICAVNKEGRKLLKIYFNDKTEEIALPADEIQFAVFDTLEGLPDVKLSLISDSKFSTVSLFGKELNKMPLENELSACAPFFLNDKPVYMAIDKKTAHLLFMLAAENKITDVEIKLSIIPIPSNLITNEKPYLLGIYENKVFCINTD